MDTTSSQRRFRMRRRPILERLEGRALLAGDFHSVLGIGGSSVLSASTAVDDAGNTVVVGNFRGTVDFDPGPKVANLSPVGVQAAFVAKYDPAGNYLWARAFTQTTGSGQAKGVAVGPGGVVYVVGNFTGTADFDPGAGVSKLTSAGSQDAFLVKLDSAGDLVWARRWGGVGNDSANAVSVDNTGRIGVGGSFSGAVDLDPGSDVLSVTSRGLDDISASVFTAAGGLVWARNVGGSLGDIAYGAAFDNAGSLYLGGVFQSTVDFDPGPGESSSSSAGGQDAFVWKLSSVGDYVWSRTWGNGYADSVAGLSSDGVNVAAVGSFQGTLEVGEVLVSRGLSDGYVVKLTGSGGVSWATSFGAGSSDMASAVASDGGGNIYVAGSFQGTVDFAPGAGVVNLSSTGGGYDGFVVKLDGASGFAWARAFGGVSYDTTTGLGINGSSTLSLTGRYSGSADFGNLSLSSAGSVSLFAGQILDAPGPVPPSVPALTAGSDTGRSSTDNITAKPSLVFEVTSAAPTNTVKLLRDGVVVATRIGPGALTDTTAPEGRHDYQAVQMDGKRQVSDPSPSLSVRVDRTAPAAPTAPRLNPADDAGVIGDGITSETRPSLVGDSESGATITIVNGSGAVLGTAISGGDGSYQVRFSKALANGVYTVRVRAADAAGNTSGLSAPLSLTISANPPGGEFDFLSAVGIGGGSVLSASTAVDDAGNTVVVGNFRGTVDFDPGPKVANLSPVGVQAAFVAKYDPAGNYLWARAFTQTTGSGQAKGVAVGPGGVVYVVGNFTGAADFDPGSGVTKLTSAGGQDAFLVKLTSAGNFVWAQRWGGKANDSANAVAVDNNGRVGVGGSFSSVVDLDPGAGTVNATSRGLDDISAQVFTAAGDLVWAKNAGGTLGDIAHGAAFDNAGSLYLGGVFQSTVDFDPGPGVSQSSSVGGQDAFVWKLSGTGDHLWSRTWGNGYADSVAGLASDGVNVAAVGSFQGTLELGGVLVSRGLSDGYVVKLTGSGGVSWSTSFGAGSSDTASAVAADGMGNIYVAGSFQKTVDFAPGAGVVNLSSTGGGYDGFVVKLDSGGGYQWARSVGGVGYDVSTGVAVAGNGDVALTGRYSGPADFGSLRLPSVGKVNLFVSRIGLAAGGAMASFSAASASASAPSLASVSAPPSLALSRTIVPDTAARSLDLGATAAALRVGPRRGGNGRSRPVLVGSKVLGQSTL